MRWAGQRRVRNRGLEAHAARGQRVQRRSGGGLVSVRTDTIGSQRVDRHEQDVRRIGGACSAGVGRTLATGRRQRDGCDEGEEGQAWAHQNSVTAGELLLKVMTPVKIS